MRVSQRAHFARLVLILALAPLAPSVISAQVNLSDPVPLGVREPAGLMDALPRIAEVGLRDRLYRFLVIPNFASAEGTSIYGLALGWVNRGALPIWPFQVRATAKHIDLTADNRERLGADLKVTLFPKQTIVKLSARAAVQKTFQSAVRHDYVLAAERVVAKAGSNAFSLGVSGAHVAINPDDGSTRDGRKVAVGATWGIGETTQLTFDYAFESDIENGSDFGFTLAVALPVLGINPTLGLTAGKHRLIATSLIISY